MDGPLSPEESLKYLQTEPGLRVELVASEPMVVDPVAVAWDERGRMFVVEDRGYPLGPGKGTPPEGQVVLLEDTDGDRKYDKRTVFADGLTFPNGVMPWQGGVYVTCAPDLYYFKDTDGDGKADVKEIVFQGFQDLSTTQLRVSHPTLAIDNWVYLTSGLTAAKVTSPSWVNREPVFLNRVDGRFRPGTTEIEPTSGTAQFGQTFDAFGRRFICSNRNHVQHVVMQQRYLQRNPHLSFSQLVEDCPDHGAACKLYPLSANIVTAAYHGGFVTSACGVTIYNGTALPDEYRGNSFTCEPAGNLVHRDVLVPDGVTFVAKRAYPTNEFLASPDNWFRPVNLAVGPDGALYVCDMYRKTIEHPEYLPEATRKVTDFESGKTMGRIYRVVAETPNAKLQTPKRFQTPKKFDLGKASDAELCDQLNNPNSWWRMTAHRLLLQREIRHTKRYLEKLVFSAQTPETRVHALNILNDSASLPEELIEGALRDTDPGVREHAIRLAESMLPGTAAFALTEKLRANQPEEFRRHFEKPYVLTERLLAMADDPNPGVRFQCALTLGHLTDDRIIAALTKIAARDVNDKWTRAAVLSAITNREDKFLHSFLLAVANHQPESLPAMMGELGHILGAALPQTNLFPVLRELLVSTRPEDRAWQMAAVSGLGEGLRARGLGSKETPALLSLAREDSSNLSAQVMGFFQRSAGLALDLRRPLAERLAAVSLLAEGDFALSGVTLEKLIEPQQPFEIQSAAIRALGRLVPAEKSMLFVQRARWNTYTPTVRDALLAVLTGNQSFLPTFLAAVEAGEVPAYTVNPERRNQLMHHKDAAIKARAEKLFKDLTPGDRMQTYEQSKSVLELPGDSRNGHAVFQKNCITCHTFGGEGKMVGPDLTGIRNQPAEVLLLHIVVPEFEIMPIYTAYNVETKSGESYSGLLASEASGSITLRMAQGIEQQIPRADIVSMTASRLSLMPQELEKAMTKQELADLLAFLKGQ